MSRFLLLFVFLSLSTLTFGQRSHHSTIENSHPVAHGVSPICESDFTDILSEMARFRGQSSKLRVAVEATEEYHFTTDQVFILMEKLTWDSDKIKLGKKAYSSCQVTELMQKLTWDSDRLKVAKAAYVKTLDFENFLAVGATFDFRSYERALQKYTMNYESFRVA